MIDDDLTVDDLEAYIAVAVIEWGIGLLDCGCTEISRHIAHSVHARLVPFDTQEGQ